MNLRALEFTVTQLGMRTDRPTCRLGQRRAHSLHAANPPRRNPPQAWLASRRARRQQL